MADFISIDNFKEMTSAQKDMYQIFFGNFTDGTNIAEGTVLRDKFGMRIVDGGLIIRLPDTAELLEFLILHNKVKLSLNAKNQLQIIVLTDATGLSPKQALWKAVKERIQEAVVANVG